MPRNIVICCDGTANEFAGDRTNVVKLYYALRHGAPDQVAFYHPGLGTMEPEGALTTRQRAVTRGLGMAAGYGLSNDIRDAYVYLMNTYRDDDRVFLFGFSRGAYTARAVCSLLAMYGLIREGNDPFAPYVVRMMMAIDKARKQARKDDRVIEEYFQLAADFKHSMARVCNPYFVGVWDTVSSVGWVDNPVRIPFSADNPFIERGRHAIAIDEKRAFFRTNLWKPSAEQTDHGPKDVKQVWFAGVHSDVGGGYPESESGLAKIALQWMLQEAKAAGLSVDAGREAEVLGLSAGSRYARPDPDGMMHESLKGAWKLAELIRKPHYDYRTGETTRRANRGRRRTIPSGSLIHDSVFARQNGAYAASITLPEHYEIVSTRPATGPAAAITG